MRIGNRLGEHVLIQRLGEGAFGEVWLAEESDRPGALVAVKVAKEGASPASLGREGRAQHSLSHPNIVRTYASHLQHDPPYLINEWVPGESLRQRLDRTRRLWVGEASRIVRLVLRALASAHGAGLVHGDVKPANVLLGPGGVVKLADFGLGRDGAVGGSIALSRGGSLSVAGGAVGTFLYMSPEQIDGRPGDHRDDLYACGVMLYEMLTGQAHPVRLPVPGVSRRLSDVIDRALAVDPEDRFLIAEEMLVALEDAECEQESSLPVPPSTRTESRSGLKAWTIFAVVAMALFYGVVLYSAIF